MTDTSSPSPRQQRRDRLGTTEAGTHTLPGVAPSASSDDQDEHGMTGEARGQLATVVDRLLHNGLILAYDDGARWYDLHPAVRTMPGVLEAIRAPRS